MRKLILNNTYMNWLVVNLHTINIKLLFMENLSWVAAVFSIVGVFLSININAWCWPIWTVANIIWFYISYKKGDKAQMMLWVVYTIVNIYGLYQWI